MDGGVVLPKWGGIDMDRTIAYLVNEHIGGYSVVHGESEIVVKKGMRSIGNGTSGKVKNFVKGGGGLARRSKNLVEWRGCYLAGLEARPL